MPFDESKPPLHVLSALRGKPNTAWCMWHKGDAPQKGGKKINGLFKCAECLEKAKQKAEDKNRT